jgi:dihydroorotate dehydrogenase electron transfer subunit
MKQSKLTVLQNTLISDHLYVMDLSWESDNPAPLPGQFCTIRVSESTAPLLRRPFAFSQFNPESAVASIIYKQCGPATDILAGKQPGDKLDVIAPLGNSFAPYASSTMNILVGGGTGLGPIYFWQQYLAASGFPAITVIGCRSYDQLPALEYPDTTTTAMCTEDGSLGFKGTTVDFLATLPAEQLAQSTIFCCGPMPMMKACFDFSQKYGNECFVSLEQIMACGVGACMGCTIKIHGTQEYARVCTEGPVFNSKIILWT